MNRAQVMSIAASGFAHAAAPANPADDLATADWSEVLGEFAHAHVICIGDVMLDRFVYGAVERISPEAPVPVLRITHEREMLGGAGNVISNLAALGASAALVSVVGADEPGRRVRELIAEFPAIQSELADDPGRTTSTKIRCVAGSQQMLRLDRETVAALSTTAASSIVAKLTAALRPHSVVVLSDYGKGVLTPELIQSVIATAKVAGRPVLVDPKGRDYAIYRGADLITPNRSELALATGMPVDNDVNVIAAARRLIDQFDFGVVVAKRSEQGMTIVTRAGEVHHLRAEAREVFDVSGAGDTVTATLATAISCGQSWPRAAFLANLAAGIAVGKIGTAPTTIGELRRSVLASRRGQSERKIQGWDEAAATILKWKAAGLSVGFTNGCYDLLHPGHVRLLEEARAACDRLVVGLNSDSSVRRLKGPTRPVQAEHARATVLASLASVDALVLFEQDTPLELIRSLRPDVLVKGADYTIQTVVGASDVQSWGGRVVLVDLVPEQSTTRLVKKMASEEPVVPLPRAA